MSKRFNHIIIGGTFDRLHLGHQQLIKTAFKKGVKVTIGLAEKELYENKPLAETIESYFQRKKTLTDFLKKNLWFSRAIIIPIADVYGTTLTDVTIDAIVVSRRTRKAAQKINLLRQKQGFNTMAIVVAADVFAEDGKLLTSERIRLGEIDRLGKNFQFSIFNFQKKDRRELILPESIRKELRIPLGKVFPHLTMNALQCFKTSKRPLVIAVGDIIVREFLKKGINPDVKVIDFKTRREKITNDKLEMANEFQILNLKKYQNRPGTINIKTAQKLKKLVREAVINKQKTWLVIDGEEDLLALPAILFAPLDSLVLYGQMDLGVVVVEVTEEIKSKVANLLEKFI